jgi:hypothetical protein
MAQMILVIGSMKVPHLEQSRLAPLQALRHP